MAEVTKKPLKITETVLRDAHQSLIATRMTTEQMLPIVDKMDQVGYHAVECWGGATFDASLRFLKEDPWDRLRKLRDGFKNTKLQMLFRGQNILGYRPYADDVVEYFVQKSIANGIDIIRIFDCLNDIRNLQTAVTACNKEKGHAQVALSYTLGDAYTLDYWMDMAKKVEDMGADSLCIKDMAGLLVPTKATELVQALKDATSLPIELHTHYTSGVASMTYMKAVEAGCDIIDTAMSPFALGTSQPATEVMVEAFKGTEFDTGLDQTKLAEIADYFRPMREEALESGLMNPKVLGVNIKTLLYQVPGGMLSNLISQLKEQGKEDKYEEVLAEVPRVRKDLGEPPLVTPSSQIVGTQAVFNVLMGERYKVATKETKDVLLGKYGQTVKPFNPEIVDKVLLHLEIVQERLEREYNLDLVTTAPGVIYKVHKTNGEVMELTNPSNLPDPAQIEYMEEPIVSAEIMVTSEYIGAIMDLCQERRGTYISMEYMEETRALLKYDLPLNEIIYDFFDALKSRSRGYASFDYEMKGYVRSNLVKLDILINREEVDALSFIVFEGSAYERGRKMCEKLKEEIPRHLFEIPIQAAVGSKIIARETVKAMRKDVLAKCYGGDITRKRKLLEKQKEGKKRMRQVGNVEIPQEAFMSVLKLDDGK